MQKLLSTGIILLFLSSFAACVNHSLEPALTAQCNEGQTVSYNSQVKPIVIANCAVSGCHDGTLGATRDWTNDNTFKSKAQDARRRILLPKSDPEHMPQDNHELSLDEIQLISCWVDQGASLN